MTPVIEAPVLRVGALSLAWAGLIGCSDGADTFGAGDGGSGDPGDVAQAALACTIPSDELIDGGPGVDGIPALTNPDLVNPSDAAAAYVRDDDRVMGLVIDGQAVAVPLNIGWWHEIVNLDLNTIRIAVTHCPLTGSSLTFDRTATAFATVGVSGLLFNNNLVMYDRNADPSLWPQMARGARCGPLRGTPIPMIPSLEITWQGWQSLYPETKVVSGETGHGRNYRAYPYGDYEAPWSPPLVPMQVDRRRPTKERVLGIPSGNDAGVALPFGVLDSLGAAAVAHVGVGGEPVVVFWDRARRAAMAYEPRASTGALTFRAEGDAIVDEETGSTWRIDGRAISGSLDGERLNPIAEAFVAFWFAWAAFYPNADLWLGPEAP